MDEYGIKKRDIDARSITAKLTSTFWRRGCCCFRCSRAVIVWRVWNAAKFRSRPLIYRRLNFRQRPGAYVRVIILATDVLICNRGRIEKRTITRSRSDVSIRRNSYCSECSSGPAAVRPKFKTKLVNFVSYRRDNGQHEIDIYVVLTI